MNPFGVILKIAFDLSSSFMPLSGCCSASVQKKLNKKHPSIKKKVSHTAPGGKQRLNTGSNYREHNV